VCVLAFTCDFDPSTRANCGGGPSGVTEAQCVERGCCYDDTVWGVPWCYEKRKYRYTVSAVTVTSLGLYTRAAVAIHRPTRIKRSAKMSATNM